VEGGVASLALHPAECIILYTECFARSFEEPRFTAGFRFLGQECAKLSAYLAQEHGREHIDISSEPVDAHKTQLCEDGGDRGTARFVIVEIEVERLLLRVSGTIQKISLLNFLMTRTGREKS
jgi:hypothetical protein